MTKRNCKPGTCLTNSKVCQIRTIKVHKTHYMHQLKNDPCGAGRPVPWIQLKGHWLQQAGFEIHSPVKIRVMDGCLVLTIDRA